jgi:hypothetical protein
LCSSHSNYLKDSKIRCNCIKIICILTYLHQKLGQSWAPMTHAYNPSYSGGRDREDQDLKPIWANSSQDPILKNPFTRKGWWSGSSGRVPV